jgi:hypothetical protein
MTQTYGKRQELIIKNLTDLSMRLPLLDERIANFMSRDLGMTMLTTMNEKQPIQPMPENVFEAIDQKMDLIKVAIENLSKRIGLLESSINPIE